MNAALYAEALKLRRSRLPWVTVGGLFMFISLHPGKARDLGLLGAKAQLATLEPTWDSYLSLLAQIAAVGGLGIFGMVMVWIFGREFAEHTAKDLLALPTGRTTIVMAKFAVAAGWSLMLAGYLIAAGLAVGWLLAIPGPVTGSGVLRIVVAAVLTIAVTTLFAPAACLGRGYLPAIGALFAAVFSAQIVAALGYGPWFPLSVPALHAGITGDGQPGPHPIGYAAVAAAVVASVMLTVWWWQRADHTR